jgi:ferredoxin
MPSGTAIWISGFLLNMCLGVLVCYTIMDLFPIGHYNVFIWFWLVSLSSEYTVPELKRPNASVRLLKVRTLAIQAMVIETAKCMGCALCVYSYDGSVYLGIGWHLTPSAEVPGKVRVEEVRVEHGSYWAGSLWTSLCCKSKHVGERA